MALRIAREISTGRVLLAGEEASFEVPTGCELLVLDDVTMEDFGALQQAEQEKGLGDVLLHDAAGAPAGSPKLGAKFALEGRKSEIQKKQEAALAVVNERRKTDPVIQALFDLLEIQNGGTMRGRERGA